jgi:hypothetical protein
MRFPADDGSASSASTDTLLRSSAFITTTAVAPKHHHVAGDVGQAGGRRDASYSIGTIVAAHTVSARNTKKPIRCLKGNCEENVVRSHALLDPRKLITW